jgi:hypothetical protein
LYERFTTELEPIIKPDQQMKIAELRTAGKHRLADRLEQVYRGWATSRQAGALLRRIDGVFPRPIEFRHSEFERGCMLARKGNNYYALVRLFSSHHRYREEKLLQDGFIDWRTREYIGDRTYPGLILPLEFGRDYHEREYLEHGRPQSAKLIGKRTDDGQTEFYFHIAFEFTPDPIIPETVLGIDRGAAKLGSGTVVDMTGAKIGDHIAVEGSAFSTEMARLREKIAELQRRGLRDALARAKSRRNYW